MTKQNLSVPAAIFAAGLLGASAHAAAAESYDLAAGFSLSSNPNGPWSYGWKSSLGGSLALLGVSSVGPADNGVPIHLWQYAAGQAPAVFKNTTTNTAISDGGAGIFPPGTVEFYAGENGTARNFCVIRFTVPAGGDAHYQVGTAVRSYLDGAISGDTDFHVLRNGVELSGQFLPGNGAANYTNVVSLAAGDTIDFAVGRGADGNQYASGLKIAGTISQTTNAPTPPPAAIVTRGPYLQAAALNSLVIRWRTDTATEGRVRYGLSSADLPWGISESSLTMDHSITLTNLSPDTRYFYSVGTSNETLAGGNGYNFWTPPVLLKPTRIWAIGDAGTASVGSQAPLLVRNAYTAFAGTNRTDVWLMLGDNAYFSGTDSEYQAAVFDVFQDMLRTTPLWPTIGNHETYAPGPGGTLAYFDIFSLPQDGQAGGVPSGTERYYSFDHGAIHFVCLDSELSDRSPGGPMLTWLEQDLAASSKDWTIAFWHSPPYSKGSHDSDFEGNLVQMRESVVPMLESYGVDLVLCGHSHSYERSYLLNGHYGLSGSLTPGMVLDGGSGRAEETGEYSKPPSGQGEGTVYVVAGSSGQTSGGSLNHPAMFISLNRLGSMVIDVQSNRLDARFLRESGAVDDRFTIIKGTLAPSIVSQPISQSVVVGNSASFNVVAGGTRPLSYQWFFNDIPIPGATNPTLTLSDVQFDRAGSYSVLVTNVVGSVTSSNALLTVNPVPECVVAPSGLVSWWPGDGTAEDMVGGNHGELRNGAGFAAGMVGQGFHFDGLGSYVRIANNDTLDFTNELTIELWYRHDGVLGDGYGLVSTRGTEVGPVNYAISVLPIGIGPYFNDPSVAVGDDADHGGTFESSRYLPVPASGVFHHLGVTFRQANSNEVELKTFIDGTLVRTKLLAARLGNAVNDAAIVIGRSAEYGGEWFDGIIDEVSLYNRALTAGEVLSIYNAGPAGKCVTNIPPTIVAGPANRTVYAGATVTFSVTAGGGRPLAYQWLYNGSDLPGATAATLTITNVQESQGGIYAVRVTNVAGSVTSADAVLTVNPAPACLSAPAGLVSWWPGDGTAEDVVGSNHGQLRNGAGFTSGMVGQGFSLNGNGQFVLVPDSATLDMSNALTLELWAKVDEYGPGRPLLDKRDGGAMCNYGMIPSTQYGLQVFYNDPQVSDGDFPGSGFVISTHQPPPSAGVFHHIAGTYQQVNATNVELKTYIDGVLVRSRTFLGSLARTVNDAPLSIGAEGAGAGAFFKGVIDEVSLYNRALTAPEVLSIYNAGPAGKCVTNIPPTIVAGPANRTVYAGATVTFSVTAGGGRPLAYQWLYNGSDLPGATAATLTITNVQESQGGIYAVRVTNVAGSVTSADAVLTVNPAPACLSAPAGLVSWWPGDGTAEDVVGSNHGQLRNGAGFTSGMVGQGFSLNGNGQFVLVPDSATLDMSNALTLELWAKVDEYGPGRPLLDKRDGGATCNYGMIPSTQYGLQVFYNDPQVSDGDFPGSGFVISTHQPPPSAGVFHHIAGTYQQVNATNVELKTYIDGVLVRSRTFLGSLARTVNDAPLSIGAEGAGAGAFFKGVIDEVSLYNRALTAPEVLSIYNAGPAGKCLTDSAPVIVTEPENRTITVGATAAISVTAAGSRPLGYQWYFKNAIISGAVDSMLVISNAQYGDSGSYQVVVTNSVGSVTSSVAMLTVIPPASQLRVLDASGPAGGVIELPIELTAQGFENALGLSAQFDHSLLAFQYATLGSSLPSGATLIVNSNEASVGRVGLAVALPVNAVFPPGTGEVVRVIFKAAVAQSAVTTPITLVDQPTARQVSDVLAQVLDLTSVNGTIQILRVPFEADVTPRPSGDFAVSIVDWVQTGRFVAGLDQVAPGEFQRLDCAPRDTGGNGVISVTDWVQAGRYAAGVDPLTPVGGPTEPAAPSSGGRFLAQASGPRTLALPVTNAVPGTIVSVPVRLAALGNENAVGFSVTFAPGSLVFDSMTAGSSASGATMNGNANQAVSGRVGIVLALPSGTTFAAGAREIALLNFKVATNATGILALGFGDQPVIREVSDAAARSLSCSYNGGHVAVGATPPGPPLSARRTGGSLLLFWPSSATGFELYSSSSVSGGPWVKAQVTPIDIGGQFIVSLPATNTQQYYRLMKP